MKDFTGVRRGINRYPKFGFNRIAEIANSFTLVHRPELIGHLFGSTRFLCLMGSLKALRDISMLIILAHLRLIELTQAHWDSLGLFMSHRAYRDSCDFCRTLKLFGSNLKRLTGSLGLGSWVLQAIYGAHWDLSLLSEAYHAGGHLALREF